MNGVAERIQKLRETSGETENEVAEAVGLSIGEYGDLEGYDDEIIDAVSFGAASKVAGHFGQSLFQLLAPEAEASPEGYLGPEALANLVKGKIAEEGLSLEEAETKTGWYLEGFLANPGSYLAEQPIMFLIDLSGFLGIDWLSTMPRGRGSS
ncbi:hypothetical protein [Thiosocius teredinicola]|uniref:hypothetical protein n=1 Tax=Thiosocius teredinicola TaxID=1973002 RepID=UPI000990FDE1